MNKIILLTFLIIGKLAFGQDTLSKACYYISMKDYTNNTPAKIGSFVNETNSDITFYYQYSKVTISSKNTWGYKNNEGELYRSIDLFFYKLVSSDKIYIYKATIDGIEKYKIALGINMYPIDLNESNVMLLISENAPLLLKYQQLSKKERISRALEFINLFNIDDIASSCLN